MFEGTYTALVTPFRNGQVDVKAFEALIERQVAAGIEGIIPMGTTGESPTLNMQEHVRVIELAVQFAKKRTKVVAGTGSNSTAEAIELSTGACQLLKVCFNIFGRLPKPLTYRSCFIACRGVAGWRLRWKRSDD